ncbi:hypothetical protein ACFYUM_00385 [Streptomyces fimicarius]|uniref:hypothetical protein n=1 Tax=Streptomyces griseus TaxID=1911 RepID=UPI0036BECF2B
MSHKQMIAWLDQANSAAVQGVADRLSSAAKEISKIGEELKIRPQIVKWKGDGADSFRTWSADLANATLRLGEFSKDASNRLGETATAIAQAKAAIPRPTGDPEASLKAAESARNDPDSAGLIKKLNGEREAAAAEMRKLSQTYSHSVAQLDNLKRPEFPPPPQAIAPPAERSRDGARYLNVGGTAGGTAPSGAGFVQNDTNRLEQSPVHPVSAATTVPPPTSPAARPVDMEIDSVATLPETTVAPPLNPAPGPSHAGKSDGLPPSTVVGLPPAGGSKPLAQVPTTAVGRTTGALRPAVPGAGPVGPANGSTVVGRPTGPGGVVGGKPVPPTAGRPAVGLPRGTVIGGEGNHAGRAPMVHGPGVGGGAGQSGIVGGRRLAGESGGVMGGRPQQAGRASGARPFTPGGTGLVRGAPEGARSAGPVGRGSSGVTPRTGERRREEGGTRPDYLTEDEETWQQGSRRIVPPVID